MTSLGATLWEDDSTSTILPPPGVLADLLDPVTGEFLSLVSGADPTDAAVVVALRTVRGSGVSVQDVGQQFAGAKTINTGTERFLREEVAFALRRLVELRQITLDSVTFASGEDWVELTVNYINEAARELRKVTMRVSGSEVEA